MEAARSMLFACNEEKQKQFLWAEAVNTAVDVVNRSGTSSMKDKTPFELWFEKSAILDNLKVFGSIVYSHIPKQNRRKLDKKSTKCVFVGYSEHSNCYRVYNPEKRTIQVVRDVVFAKASRSEIETTQNVSDVVIFDSVSAESATEKETNVSETNVSETNKTSNETENNVDTSLSDSVADTETETETNARQSDQNTNESVVVIESSDDEVSFHSTDSTEENESDFDPNYRRISGKRICNVDERNVVEQRLRKDVISNAEIASVLLSLSDEPKSYNEAIETSDKIEWRKAMDDEYQSLIKNNTWQLINAPKGESIIDNKWVFKIKRRPDGSVERYKASLVARGFTQKYGINYKETFSPVVRHSSIRAILAICAARKMTLLQFDVKTAFLYGELTENVYMKQPVGYNDGSGKVCKLLKSLYGLKQASRCWNSKFTAFIE